MSRQQQAEVKLGKQGRLVIPSGLRRSLGFEPGDALVARVEGRRLVVESREELLIGLQHELRTASGGRSLVDELIGERRREASREAEDEPGSRA